jgi:hypothetical protein
VTEVAESSLQRDHNKRRLYVRAGIGVYWIIILVDRQIEVYRDPVDSEHEPSYGEEQVYRLGETVPLVIDGEHLGDIPVVDFMP